MKETAERDLAAPSAVLLHVLLGEASLALAILRSTDQLPDQGRETLRRLAEQLTSSTESLRSPVHAVGEVDRFELALAANSVFGTTAIQALGDQLEATAGQLLYVVERIGSEQKVDRDVIDVLMQTLRGMEDAVAVMDSTRTDEISAGDNWYAI